MRTRDWRRYQEELHFIRRIKRFCRSWYHFHTANGDKIYNPIWVDFIGLKDFFFYKHGTTRQCDSKYKTKYSPNKPSYYRDPKPGRFSYRTREKDKTLAQKIIKEYWNDRYSEDL